MYIIMYSSCKLSASSTWAVMLSWQQDDLKNQ